MSNLSTKIAVKLINYLFIKMLFQCLLSINHTSGNIVFI